MDNRRKKKLTFLTIGLIFLLSGVEYGKICFGVFIGDFLVRAGTLPVWRTTYKKLNLMNNHFPINIKNFNYWVNSIDIFRLITPQVLWNIKTFWISMIGTWKVRNVTSMSLKDCGKSNTVTGCMTRQSVH